MLTVVEPRETFVEAVELDDPREDVVTGVAPPLDVKRVGYAPGGEDEEAEEVDELVDILRPPG